MAGARVCGSNLQRTAFCHNHSGKLHKTVVLNFIPLQAPGGSGPPGGHEIILRGSQDD